MAEPTKEHGDDRAGDDTPTNPEPLLFVSQAFNRWLRVALGHRLSAEVLSGPAQGQRP
jgi:hypothetical protein